MLQEGEYARISIGDVSELYVMTKKEVTDGDTVVTFVPAYKTELPEIKIKWYAV